MGAYVCFQDNGDTRQFADDRDPVLGIEEGPLT